MTTIVLRPGPVSGRIHASPSKSYTHRALVVAHLSGRRFRVEHPLDSDDTRATAGALDRLGTPVEYGRESWIVRPGLRPSTAPASLDCGESGTTLRFLSAVAARSSRSTRFTGRARLGARPMRGLLHVLKELGASVRVAASGLPIDIRGPLRGGRVRVDASQSSQFVSSLLLTLPTLPEESRLELTGEIVSEPYIEATLAVLDHHRVKVVRRGRKFTLPGGQTYRGSRFVVPGDASSAAYLWAAGALTGGTVRVDGVPKRWPQADRGILPVLRRFGAHVRIGSDSVSVSAGDRRPFSVDLTDSPDLYPLVGVLAALAPGTSRIHGAAQVRFKESDRRAGTLRLVRALGASAKEVRGGLQVRGVRKPRAVRLGRLADHRMVMSAAVAAVASDGSSRIGDSDAIRKSYPEFWEDLRGIGVEVRSV
ncbi:MAG: 3-phosphoshikimate 1-carboxyvinyltransferase [Thermoplasmata archaeon]